MDCLSHMYARLLDGGMDGCMYVYIICMRVLYVYVCMQV